MVVHLKNLDNK